MSGFADFPLAKGLSTVVNPLIPGIVDGTGSEMLDQVTPVTAELLRYWFQLDYCELRELNFHAGQRAAIRSAAASISSNDDARFGTARASRSERSTLTREPILTAGSRPSAMYLRSVWYAP